MKFISDNGEEQEAYLDGYYFADRLLEGVLFKCVIENDKVKVIGPAKENDPYFKKLNRETFLQRAQEFAEKTDSFCDLSGKKEIWIEE